MEISKQTRVHDYTRQAQGHDYAIEAVDNDKHCMTGQGANIQPGDHLLLKDETGTVRYRVETIDYYLEPPDLWIALLQQVEP